MSDIFLSYASTDLERVRLLVRALERHGWSVWWDRTIPPGKTFDQVIEEALDAARCVVVVWSRTSAVSRWVLAEAEEGLLRDALVPVLIEETRLPLAFRRIQAARLADWQDSGPHPEFARLLQAVTDLIGPPAAATSPGTEPLMPPQSAGLPASNQAPAVSPPPPPPQRPPQPMQSDPHVPRPAQSATPQTRPGRRRRVWLGGVVACVLLTALYVTWRILPASEGPAPPQSPGSSATSSSTPKPARLSQTLTNSLGMAFVLIPAGEFAIGSPDGFDAERPVHTVRISQAFYLGTYEVTQGQWQALMGTNPSKFQGDPQRPVEQVSWEEVQAFIQKLNAKEGGTRYRLPTEAEWEYAARAAGTTTAYSFGNDAAQLGQYAWYDSNAGGTTHPVGQLRPNAWGLYDMHGNVWEWVQDWYGAYAAALAVDPQGPAAGASRVVRGGGWFSSARACRSAFRSYAPPGIRDGYLGVRLLRTAP